MNLESIAKWLLLDADKAWIIQVFLVVLVTVVIAFLESRIYHRLKKKAEMTHTIWDEAILTSIQTPLVWLIWILGLTYAMEITSFYTPSVKLFDMLPSLRKTGIIVLMVWFLWRLIKNVERAYIKRAKSEGNLDPTTATAVSQILRISVLITGVLVILPIFDIKITGLLAVGGAGTLIAGLAAQDLLSNFFGALTIYLDRPFAVGDWIRSPDRELEGTVEYIGWRLTLIRTFDKRPLYVPNAIFSKIAIENPSRMTNRRIREVVGIRYCDADKLDAITRDIKDMLLNHHEIDTTQACFVNFITFGPSSLDILIYTFTKTTAWIPYQGIKQDVLLKILNIILKHGAEVAFPTRTLDIPEAELNEMTNLTMSKA